jgi:carboxylesterase type B
LQSPGFTPGVSNYQQETTFQTFLSLLNVTTLAEARKLPASALIAANYKQTTYMSPSYNTLWGPVVDGSFVPQMPTLLIRDGKFDHGVSVMYGHNELEGLLFTNVTINDDAAYRAQIQHYLPTIQPGAIKYIANSLYPPTFDGSEGYADQLWRTVITTQDIIFLCNGMAFTEAFGDKTYNYMFAVPPALHGTDVVYTFYTSGGIETGVQNPTIAQAMQKYFTSFVIDGEPLLNGTQSAPMYGSDGNMVVFNITGVDVQKESTWQGERCSWWHKGLFI